jgi:hypothetical protein
MLSQATGSSTWWSNNTPVATVNNTTYKGRVTGQSGGTAGILASFTDQVVDNAWYPDYQCHYYPQTSSDNGTANVQQPGYVGVTGSTADTVRCGTSSFFARRLRVNYQVLDSSPGKAPILRAGMTVAEQLTWSSSVCTTSDACGQRPTPGLGLRTPRGGLQTQFPTVPRHALAGVVATRTGSKSSR